MGEIQGLVVAEIVHSLEGGPTHNAKVLSGLRNQRGFTNAGGGPGEEVSINEIRQTRDKDRVAEELLKGGLPEPSTIIETRDIVYWTRDHPPCKKKKRGAGVQTTARKKQYSKRGEELKNLCQKIYSVVSLG